jgi:hypothetical protein
MKYVNRSMAILIIMLCIALCTIGTVSCTQTIENNADAIQARQTQDLLAEANRAVGMPKVVNWQQKKLHRWILELCDQEDLICYAYVQNKMTGKFIFLYKCLGFGIPFSAQYTSPEKLIEGDKYLGYDLPGALNGLTKLPQADPNGLFMPTASSATWIIPIDPEDGNPRVIYAEPEIVISPMKFRTSIVQNPEDYQIYDHLEKDKK